MKKMMIELIYAQMYAQWLVQNNIVVTGTKKLFGDLLVAAQGIAIPVVLVMCVWWQIQKSTAEDNEESRFTKKQKGALIGLIFAELIGVIVGSVGGYYGISI